MSYDQKRPEHKSTKRTVYIYFLKEYLYVIDRNESVEPRNFWFSSLILVYYNVNLCSSTIYKHDIKMYNVFFLYHWSLETK